MRCEKEEIIIETHYVNQKFMEEDGIGRWHTNCKVCNTPICLLRHKDAYEDGERIRVYLGGEKKI